MRPAFRELIGALLGLVVTGLFALPPGAARAAFPDRPIRIVVPFAPGGASDLIARAISGPLQQELGQPVIVENHAGANGNIGIGFAAKADPDGYTLFFCGSGKLLLPLLCAIRATPRPRRKRSRSSAKGSTISSAAIAKIPMSPAHDAGVAPQGKIQPLEQRQA